MKDSISLTGRQEHVRASVIMTVLYTCLDLRLLIILYSSDLRAWGNRIPRRLSHATISAFNVLDVGATLSSGLILCYRVLSRIIYELYRVVDKSPPLELAWNTKSHPVIKPVLVQPAWKIVNLWPFPEEALGLYLAWDSVSI